MFPAFIKDRASLSDASDLIDRYGEQAAMKASALAAQSRDAGNVARYCHWRHIQRVIALLRSEQARGTVQ